MSDQVLSARQLAVGYHGKAVVQGVEIQLRRGQILTLIGPNGSGKSTILKSIAGHLKPLQGVVWLDGRDMAALSGKEVAQRLSLVLTQRLRPERMTCEDVVATGRYPFTGRLGLLTAEDRRKVAGAMQLVHALPLRDQDFNAISDGQRQRVMLARAICQEPELIVLDEPTSYLDVKFKLELLNLLKTMVREKRVAVILSLHELELAQKVSDMVLCVKEGRIERYGPPQEVFQSDYIQHLYDMTEGSYNHLLGCMELTAPSGPPQVFVIAGGGRGIPVFRQLQRQGIPFATGILHENDIDWEIAKSLACAVASEKPFEPIGGPALEKGKRLMAQCGRVLCCLQAFGPMNQGNQELLAHAAALGLPVEQVAP